MKKKVNKKSSKKTKFNYKQFLIGVFAILLFTLLLGFVQVGPQIVNNGATGNAIFGSGGSSFIKDLFTGWQTGQGIDLNIAKYILFFILTLLIFSILRMTDFPPGGALQFIISLLVSFLAVAYITPEEVFVIITTYSSLGVVLTSIVPFLILCLFTTALVSPIRVVKGQNVVRPITLTNTLFSILIWFFFNIYNLYRLIYGLVTGALTWPAVPVIIMVVVTGVAMLFLFFHKKFMEFIGRVSSGILQTQNIVNTGAVRR